MPDPPPTASVGVHGSVAVRPRAGGPAPSASARGRHAASWLAIDRFEALALLAFAALGVAILVALWSRPLELTGADSLVPADQLQYLSWIREAASGVVIDNLWDVDPSGTSYFVHPGFLLSGALHAAGVGLWESYHLLWKPVAILALFFGFLAYVRRMLPAGTQRRAGLVLALLYVSPFVALNGVLFEPAARVRGQLDFLAAEILPLSYVWGYMMTAIAVALIPVVLLCVERTRVPEQRRAGRGAGWYVTWGAVAAFLMAYLQPWQAVAVLACVAAVELIRARGRGARELGRGLRVAAPVALAATIPLAYYLWMSQTDPSWALVGDDNLSRVGNWPWYAWVLALAPLAIPAALAYRLPAPGWQDVAVRVLPLAMVAEYFAISLTGAGTFPFHSVQGMTLPLAVLAVAGAASWRGAPAALRSPVAVWGAVALLTLPGIAHKLNIVRIQVHGGGFPYFVDPGERAALRYLEDEAPPGAVMAPLYSGLLVPPYTGRETWLGQTSWTRDFDERLAIGDALFAGDLEREDALRAIRDARVSFLLGDCVRAVDLEPLLAGYLRDVRRFGCAAVYELDRAALERLP